MPSITNLIGALPPAPDPSTDDSTTFSAKATAFTLALTTLPGQVNAAIAQMNALAVGSVFGDRYVFSSTTTATDPTTGKVQFNNATLSAVTAMYLSETDADGLVKSAYLATWDDNVQALKGLLRVVKASTPTVYVDYQISGSLTDNGTWDTFLLSYVGGNGVLVNGDSVMLQFQRAGADGVSAVLTSPTRVVAANGNVTSADNGYNLLPTANGVTLTCDTAAALAGSSVFFYATQFGVLLSGSFINADGTASTVKAVPRGSAAILTSDGTNLRLEVVPPTNVFQQAFNASATLGLVDQGVDNYHTSATAHTATIPANASVAYPVGTCLVFTNGNGAGVLTIAVTTDTMRQAGSGTTGSRNLAANGTAVAKKVSATEWLISGSGLS